MRSEAPILILSQDYELFFDASGTVEKCLFEPCDALLETARHMGLRITFFVDAGMILCLEREAAGSRVLAKMLRQVKSHISSIAAAGHEIALHVHPHWEDTRWEDGAWQFSNTRYQLRQFSVTEIESIFRSYSDCLAELSGSRPSAYRAGGFCIEPFHLLRKAFSLAGISIDSSVVPGAFLDDPDKGFDFRRATDVEWWFFDDSPLTCVSDGAILELPVTPQRLPSLYYWQRLGQRLTNRGRSANTQYGDGTSKGIGKREIMRRLMGVSRVAELSVDEPKVVHLAGQIASGRKRRLWHLMGHPKLLSMRALGLFQEFVSQANIGRFETMTSVAALIGCGESSMGSRRRFDPSNLDADAQSTL